jgi:hypothetical protein
MNMALEFFFLMAKSRKLSIRDTIKAHERGIIKR